MRFTAAIRLGQRAFPILIAISLGLWSLVATQPAVGQVFQQSEDFATDPGWDGFGNMVDPQLFGFSNTANAGGPAGEAGGTIVRTSLAYYADNVGALDPSDTTLTMTGSAAITGPGESPSGNVLVGWFDKFTSLEWVPANFIGWRVDEQDIYLRASNGGEVQVNQGLGDIDVGVPFTYDVTFDPTANGGNGSMTATFNLTIGGFLQEANATLDFGGGDADAYTDLNRFGLLNLFIPGSDTTTEFFFDDLTYTSDQPIPDPTDYVWVPSGPGDWNVGANWDLTTAPNSNEHTAIFGGAISGASTVYTESNVTVKRIQFDNPNSYGITGTAGVSLTMEADTGNASIQVDQGSHGFQLPVNLSSNTDVEVASGTLAFDNALNLGTSTLTKTGGGSLLVNNADRSGTGTIDVDGGTLGGGGGIGGDLNNNSGTVAPGESVGTLNVDGGFTQADGATLAIELAGTADGMFDVLDVAGNATVDGQLDVELIDFAPTAGNTFDVLLASNITDNGLEVSSSFSFEIVSNNTILRLTFGFEADFDQDGDVDGNDFLLWQVGFGAGITSGAMKMDGDYDNDGDVDGNDFLGWQVEFPSPGGGSGGSAVPEPSSLVLLCVALVGVLGWFRTGGPRMQSVSGRITTSVGIAFLAAGAIVGASAQPVQAQTFLKVEDFGSDPGWDAVNNIDAGFLYEFFWQGDPATNFAAGDPGEIGGFIPTQPSPAPAYFADNIGTLDPSADALTVSGKGVIQSNDGGFTFFGWFDKDSNLTHVNADGSSNFMQFLGIRTDDERIELFADNNRLQLARPQTQEPFTFSLTYDPSANGGDGALMGNVNGGATGVLNLAPGLKDTYNDFDRFGMLADQNLEATPRFSEWYYDDLVYTTSIPQPPILEVEWANDASGNAASGGSWSPGLAPNSNEMTAILGSAITASRTAFADTDILMKTLEFDNANSYVVAGQGTLNLEADTGNASIDVVQGSHELRIEVSLGSNLDVDVPLGETLTFDNLLDLNGFTLNKLGDGDMVINNTLILDGGAISDPGGTVIINTAVPEPSSTVLAALLLLAVAALRKRGTAR